MNVKKTNNSRHILIVDDHDISLRVVSHLLQRNGHQYQLASSAIEAVTLANQQKFDVILMDIHMPDVNGVEAVKRIRNTRCINQTTPIIALTADSFSLSLRELINIGFNDRLIKPVTEQDLFYQLDNWFNNNDDNNKGTRKNTHNKDKKAVSTLNELRAMLLKELPTNLAQLEDYQRNNDSEAIHQLTHRLYGASCYVDWPNLKEAASTLESHILNAQDPDKIDKCTRRLTQTIAQIIKDNA